MEFPLVDPSQYIMIINDQFHTMLYGSIDTFSGLGILLGRDRLTHPLRALAGGHQLNETIDPAGGGLVELRAAGGVGEVT